MEPQQRGWTRLDSQFLQFGKLETQSYLTSSIALDSHNFSQAILAKRCWSGQLGTSPSDRFCISQLVPRDDSAFLQPCVPCLLPGLYPDSPSSYLVSAT
eukprot:6041050-Pleurochrysis_carterae.AAC.1